MIEDNNDFFEKARFLSLDLKEKGFNDLSIELLIGLDGYFTTSEILGECRICAKKIIKLSNDNELQYRASELIEYVNKIM